MPRFTARQVHTYLIAHAGQWLAVVLFVVVPSAAAHKGRLTKRSAWTGRGAIDYDRTADTIAAREDGRAPAENAGLQKWQEWDPEFAPADGSKPRTILRHKESGKQYVRLYKQADAKTTTTYYYDGVQITRSEVEQYVTPSQWRTMNTPSDRDTLTLSPALESIEVLGDLTPED